MQGDQVLVEVLPPAPPAKHGRAHGENREDPHRRNPTVVGIFHYARGDRAQGNYVVPFDER